MQLNTYSPFTDEKGFQKNIYQIEYSDLYQLKEKGIEEGPYIEYKRELSESVKKKIGNFITSFANEHGGWFFIGIDEKDIGINTIEKAEYELIINNILKDTTSPIPKVIIRFLTPNDDKSKGVIVVFIPEGDNPPYISKGKIYRRVGSGSSPLKEVEDRYYLDRLYDKSKQNIKAHTDFCKREISIDNSYYDNFAMQYIDRGMINIYFIPLIKFNVCDEIDSSDFVKMAIDKSQEVHKYLLTDETRITWILHFLSKNLHILSPQLFFGILQY